MAHRDMMLPGAGGHEGTVFPSLRAENVHEPSTSTLDLIKLLSRPIVSSSLAATQPDPPVSLVSAVPVSQPCLFPGNERMRYVLTEALGTGTTWSQPHDRALLSAPPPLGATSSQTEGRKKQNAQKTATATTTTTHAGRGGESDVVHCGDVSAEAGGATAKTTKRWRRGIDRLCSAVGCSMKLSDRPANEFVLCALHRRCRKGVWVEGYHFPVSWCTNCKRVHDYRDFADSTNGPKRKLSYCKTSRDTRRAKRQNLINGGEGPGARASADSHSQPTLLYPASIVASLTMKTNASHSVPEFHQGLPSSPLADQQHRQQSSARRREERGKADDDDQAKKPPTPRGGEEGVGEALPESAAWKLLRGGGSVTLLHCE